MGRFYLEFLVNIVAKTVACCVTGTKVIFIKPMAIRIFCQLHKIDNILAVQLAIAMRVKAVDEALNLTCRQGNPNRLQNLWEIARGDEAAALDIEVSQDTASLFPRHIIACHHVQRFLRKLPVPGILDENAKL